MRVTTHGENTSRAAHTARNIPRGNSHVPTFNAVGSCNFSAAITHTLSHTGARDTQFHKQLVRSPVLSAKLLPLLNLLVAQPDLQSNFIIDMAQSVRRNVTVVGGTQTMPGSTCLRPLRSRHAPKFVMRWPPPLPLDRSMAPNLRENRGAAVNGETTRDENGCKRTRPCHQQSQPAALAQRHHPTANQTLPTV